ncbi:ATP-binding cassette domain-containing protein [Clostridium botulinum]|uniref:ATP-binding cassette domain-containing protein n=1 Tax=Clostridium botulinum TaxID=1491 RepID=UPI000773FD68|nr:ATP-binding cassette domain-containing protein [Clostridium botulinum]AUN02829.1 bacitracin ABC transporter ATP-binding protein [Clostridium botulinum]MBN3398374.1 bacitracin ABC transporter ATP-binding protein [Clostridium botulinum]MBN3414237.1 bacitracin ABC transporter ATP-binding protein [Clostridium botulinum]
MKKEYAMEIHDLTKEIDGKAILSGITMNVKKGEMYGFLGANGAGKTTLMKTIYGILKPTSGSICTLGNELKENNCGVFRKMGSLIEIPVFYHNFSAYKNLELHCGYMGAQYIVSPILLGLVPLYIGMIRKSTIATIVSSLIIVCIASNSQGSTAGLISVPEVAIMFGVIGLIFTVLAIKKIMTSDLY